MHSEILPRDEDVQRLVEALRNLIPDAQSVAARVAEIVADVRAHGEEALLRYTQELDTGGRSPRPVAMTDGELEAAGEALKPELCEALQEASANVRKAAEAAVVADRTVPLAASEVIHREAPVERAAVYVPGGRAPYPSTVVMGVVTAQAAGVGEVAVCSPPGPDGEIDPVVAGACALVGASHVYRMGGAQAVAALAYGTRSVRAVDVIVGPGNLWVQEAKRQVSGRVGIDSFAGPSDLLVIADGDAESEPIALDLLAQAEHGLGTLVLAASTSSELLRRLAGRLTDGPETGAVCRLLELSDLEHGRRVAQAFAPEHLQLIGAGAERLASRISTAGCVFVGPDAATAFGDYIAGSNHVLPTGGAARFASALSPRAFRRAFTEVRVTDPTRLARLAAPLARAEGFEFHARSMEARIRENGSG